MRYEHNNETVQLLEGDICNVDCGTHGFRIEGPGLLVFIKQKTAADATEDKKEIQNHRC